MRSTSGQICAKLRRYVDIILFYILHASYTYIICASQYNAQSRIVLKGMDNCENIIRVHLQYRTIDHTIYTLNDNSRLRRLFEANEEPSKFIFPTDFYYL